MSRLTAFYHMFHALADRSRDLVEWRTAEPAPPLDRLLQACRALLWEEGEATGTSLACAVVAAYGALEEAERDRFFESLATEFAPDPQAIDQAAEAFRQAPGPDTVIALQRAVEPPRQELFRRINAAPGGTQAMVALREALLPRLKHRPVLTAIDHDLVHLFRSWFNRGFLTLERIDWRTPAAVLEKLIRYDTVHEINGWPDLRRRLERDRRCFGFFHPALLDEPLIFVEVALTVGIADTVQPLIETAEPVRDPYGADTAIFYSINNCQVGLRGISFGNFLIKQVVAELSRELPELRTFATLSPIPGFRSWLEGRLPELLARAGDSPIGRMLGWLRGDRWWRHDRAAAMLREPLMQLCAHYLLHEKSAGGAPRDPVARFHLGNGARLLQINWLADRSSKGLATSYGLMVNYDYRPAEIVRNHEAFVKDHKVVAARPVETLARGQDLAGLLEKETEA